jgi:hypothetical protein
MQIESESLFFFSVRRPLFAVEFEIMILHKFLHDFDNRRFAARCYKILLCRSDPALDNLPNVGPFKLLTSRYGAVALRLPRGCKIVSSNPDIFREIVAVLLPKIIYV